MNRRQRRRRARLRMAAVLSPLLGLALLYGVGLSLPLVQVERIEVSVAASPETVWTVLTDLDAMPAWRQDLASLERLPAPDGVLRWREVSRSGRVTAFERVDVAPLERMVVRPAGQPAGRRRVYELIATGANTRLAIRDERTHHNPLVRAFDRVIGEGRGELDGWARDLASRLSGRRQQIAGAGAAGGH